jgi:uncharacterized protein (DUF427 family)
MSAPGHHIEVRQGEEKVVVRVNGTVVATSSRPVVLTETGAPVRYYLPEKDVAMDLLVPTPTTSHCPFKGDAVYWSVRTGDGPGDLARDVVWSYPRPLDTVSEISGLLAFWPERPGVTMEVADTAG